VLIGHIQGATRVLGRQQGYFGLPLRDEVVACSVNGSGTPVMVTAWEPTPDEIAKIVAGAKIYLKVVGTAHPPVMLEVGDPPVAEG
jgi:hypothetical protein